MADWTPTSGLAQIVNTAGFLYDPAQGIIYSRMDALQRPFGYAYLYDASALLMDAVIDCEPIFFTAQNKMWMIELWKGQYGLETGCEIGVYNRPLDPPAYYTLLDAVVGTRPYDPAHAYFYQSADDADMLQMSFTLKRNGVRLFTRGPERHWWLTGFKWGVYSTPDQLTVDVSISLPAADMHAGFVAALKAMNYHYEDDGTTVTFQFGTPFAPQLWMNARGLEEAQAAQKAIVDTYRSFGLPDNDPNRIPAELAAKIESAVVARGAEFLGALMTSRLRDAGQTGSQVAGMLATNLGAAAETVTGLVTKAGYDIEQWVQSVYAVLAEIFTFNYSTAVEVHNLAYGGVAPSTLSRESYGIKNRWMGDCGTFMVQPPRTIPAGSVGRFYVKDKWGAEGGEGWVTYSYVDSQANTRTVTFTFGCPTLPDANYARCDQPAFAVYAQGGESPDWGPKGSVPEYVHPLYVAYVWAQGPAPGSEWTDAASQGTGAAAQAKHQIVVVSDLHIADDGPTVWYQSTIHNPYLGGICNWVVANAATIREMVLLGDVVDFWTYPADVKPPSFAQIAARQPEIFGPTGFFGKVLDALDGAVTYVPGNHDMGVTAADVANIVGAGGHAMKFADSVYYPLGAGDHRIALAHGNAYTMFNAQDPNTPWAPLPVGHFITRMIASQMARDGKTVATLPNQGSPNGLDFSAIVESAIATRDFGISKALLDSVARDTGTPPNQTFVLPGGRVVALDADVHPAHADLFTNWAKANGGDFVGYLIAGKSALADAKYYFMGWFAQREAFQSGARVIVMGHTHTPISNIDTTIIQYANTGFGCPSTADMPPQTVSFVVIDTDTLSTQVMQSTAAGAAISPLAAPTTPIVQAGEDYSSYVTIENNGRDDMALAGPPIATDGYWVVAPPAKIAAGARTTFWLQDYPAAATLVGLNGAAGTEGSVTYESSSRGRQAFTFRCGTALPNTCSGGSRFRTKSGGGLWSYPGRVESHRYPFYVDFDA